MADGAKVTAKEHVPPGARLPVQVDALIANSAALSLTTFEIVTGVPPALDSVNVFAALDCADDLIGKA